ncbi:MAG TPA: hypothetical protein PLE19_03030 [Planctomycetota bacterium]|nr:hypothetical protein [Planctomycetota bacterium]HRR80654.1 hypothetical protein [Planctomycetota bacterium]HRT95013.1 hypothetical protein [Planctomycetota bacterium]
MRTVGLCLGAALAACVALAAAGEATGRIAGTLTPAGKALKVGAVERIPATIMKLMDRTHWGKVDPKTGEYSVEGLAPRKYDLAVETAEGRIEGVELRVLGEENEPTYDLNPGTGELKVQRFDEKQLAEEGEVLTPEERRRRLSKELRLDKLEDHLKKLLTVAQFMDTNRVLYIHGTPKRAVVLMELARKSAFYADKGGEVIWRIETYPYLWMGDVWHKPNKGLQVLQRLRLDGREFAKMGYVYDPALGGIEVKAGQTTKWDYTLPDKLPPSLGKVPE